MFTGIVQGVAKVIKMTGEEVKRLEIEMPESSTDGLEIGASISLNGVCLTVVSLNPVGFDIIQETLSRTNIALFEAGNLVNFERALKFGDELGGHMLSGHVLCTGEVIERNLAESLDLHIDVPSDVMQYIQEKGFIAVDGISLTIGKTDDTGFWVHLIPETMHSTIIGNRAEGDLVNIEIDSMTQMVVNTVKRMLEDE